MSGGGGSAPRPPSPGPRVLDEVVDTRRHLHAHPELSFQEAQTSRLVRERLAELGLEARPCPTETGAVALLETGRPGRTVLLRADIDALPIVEDSGVPFPSRDEGRMHACGHDAHTAILLGAARTLAGEAERLAGRFAFVFQPAEEIVSGAREMIAGGLLTSLGADVALGLHTWAPEESGTITARPGLAWAGSDAFEAEFRGPGGHGGTMGRRGNVISAQAFLLERLATIVEGLEHEGTACHATAGQVVTDGAWNIVPRGAVVRGSVRTFTADLRREALGRLQDLLVEAGTEFEVDTELRLVHGTVPLVNHPGVAEVVLEEGRRLVGDRCLRAGRPLTVSDDMAEVLTRVPGCYFMLGCRPPDLAQGPSHHSPGFRIDEAALGLGVRLMVAAAVRLAGDETVQITGAGRPAAG